MDTDVILSDYAVLKVPQQDYPRLDKTYILGQRQEPFGCLCLTNQKQFYMENYPGMFVIVDVKREKGIHILSIRPNNTNPVETTYLTTEEENRAIGNVGADGLLIIGCTTFNGLAAYDGQCPSCLANSTSRQFPLSFEAHGQAVSCSTCHRRYELNYSGTSSDGTRLIEYRVWIEGAFLRVTNG